MVSFTTTVARRWSKDKVKMEIDMTGSVATTRAMFGFPSLQRRDYRLIDNLHQPHPHLDGLYESMEEALADAIGWIESMGPGGTNTSIGLEVSTPSGCWRTIRQPELLLCHWPQQLEHREVRP